ncbi:CIC11C00000001084 [Sungouiella intermedia]|uniref:CIC11C00000001084 n=1 Tax=Sungouiella intermedia TaxID=45354 RepID=A0A1L0DPR6_9ASCO|nr:CIC11C00000001084 [[Candida] intermedia]
MISTRKLRLVVIALAAICVVFVLYAQKDSYSLAESESAQHGSLIESANNAKTDAAINKEISKDKDGTNSPQQQGSAKLPAEPITSGPFDPATEFLNTRAMAPMTVFSKSCCPYSKRLKQLLKDNYSITPEPTVVELDKHEHGAEFQEYLAKVTKRRTVPNLIVGASPESRGGCDDIVKLHEEGKLLELLNVWGDKKMSVKLIEKPLNA